MEQQDQTGSANKDELSFRLLYFLLIQIVHRDVNVGIFVFKRYVTQTQRVLVLPQMVSN